MLSLQQVCELFNKHNIVNGQKLELESIERNDNTKLMEKFEEMKKEYEQRYGHVPRVHWLFHGTKDSNVDRILQNNLDISLAGKNSGCRFGAGASFSAQASYASHYADRGPMGTLILFRVLVSEIIEVEEEENLSKCLREPPYIPDRYPLRYDTTAKNKDTMDVVVKFEKNSFCPSHVVKFKRGG